MTWAGAVTAGAMALGSIVSSFAGKRSSGNTSLSNTSGRQIISALRGMSNQTGNQSMWNRLLDTLGSMSKNVGYYANSALDYYMEDLAFQKQVDYNFKAMAKEFDYTKKSMAEQFKYDTQMQDRSYDYSLQLQNAQNEWSKMMSDTSHQREVADLRLAGLNPILSANSGATGYTSGSAIIGGNTPTPNSGVSANGVQKPNYGSAVDRYTAMKRMDNETAETQARIEKINQETRNLQWTKEGMLSQGADALSTIFSDPNSTLWSDGTVTSAKIMNSGLLSSIGGLVGNLFSKLKRAGQSDGNRSYKWIDDNLIKQISDLFSGQPGNSPQIIHTKYGDLEDIDDYIRKKYQVFKPIK